MGLKFGMVFGENDLLANAIIIFNRYFHRKKRSLCQKIYTLLNRLCIFYSTVLIKECLLFTRNIIGTVFASIKFKEGGLHLRNLY